MDTNPIAKMAKDHIYWEIANKRFLERMEALKINLNAPDKITAQWLSHFFLVQNWGRFTKYRGEFYYFRTYFFEKFSPDIIDEFANRIRSYNGISENVKTRAYKAICNHPLFNNVPAYSEAYAEEYITFEDGAYRIYDGVWFEKQMDNIFPDMQINWVNQNQIIPLNEIFTTCVIKARYLKGTISQPVVFTEFIRSITGGDTLLTKRIWEIIGYFLAPDMSRKCFVVFQGVGNSGKSVLAEFIRSFFNDEATISLGIEDFRNASFGRLLFGRRLATCMELSEAAIAPNVVRGIKNATGNDLLKDKKKNFHNQCKLLFGTNYPVVTKTPSKEFFDRFISVPFRYSIPMEAQDTQLLTKLLLEKDAVAYYALQAYRLLQENGYRFSGDFIPNDPSLFPETDPQSYGIFSFIKQCCEFCPYEESRMTTEELYEAFMESECAVPDLSVPQFGKQLSQILKSVYPGKTQYKHWYVGMDSENKKLYKWGEEGICLKTPDTPESTAVDVPLPLATPTSENESNPPQ